MKILAIGNILPDQDWDDMADILKEEARRTYELYLEEFIREIYFTDTGDAVIVAECSGKSQAQKILNSLPLVREKIMNFTYYELSPYAGFSRLMNN
jgi:hypothetical protein